MEGTGNQAGRKRKNRKARSESVKPRKPTVRRKTVGQRKGRSRS